MKLFGQDQLAQPRGLQAIDQPVVCDGYRFLPLEQIKTVDRAPWNIAFRGLWLQASICTVRGLTVSGQWRWGVEGGWHRTVKLRS